MYIVPGDQQEERNSSTNPPIRRRDSRFSFMAYYYYGVVSSMSMPYCYGGMGRSGPTNCKRFYAAVVFVLKYKVYERIKKSTR